MQRRWHMRASGARGWGDGGTSHTEGIMREDPSPSRWIELKTTSQQPPRPAPWSSRAAQSWLLTLDWSTCGAPREPKQDKYSPDIQAGEKRLGFHHTTPRNHGGAWDWPREGGSSHLPCLELLVPLANGETLIRNLYLLLTLVLARASSFFLKTVRKACSFLLNEPKANSQLKRRRS